MGKKDLLAEALYRAGILWLLGVWNRFFKKRLVILAYHRILPNWDDSFPGDLELISASSQDFDWQMQLIKKQFNVIDFNHVLDVLNHKQKARNAIVVTFDDGFADNYLHAYPILSRNRVPATIFVSTDYLGTNETFWFEQVAEIYQRLLDRGEAINLPDIGYAYSPDQQGVSREQGLFKLLSALKNAKNEQRVDAIAQLKLQLGYTPLTVDQISRPMTWPEAGELRQNNIAIESHTCSHPILSQCDDNQLANEIIGSKKKIEEQLGACKVIAFPVGRAESYDKRVLDLVTQADYALGCSYQYGVNRWDQVRRFELRRINVERHTTRARFYASIVLPEIF